MPACSFKMCSNHSGRDNKDGGITFHAFPKDGLWRYKWQNIVRKQRRELDWIATSNSRICSAHFSGDDMYITKKGLRKIKNGAIPFSKLIYNTPERNSSPNSLENEDISDSDSIFDSPEKAYFKQKINELNENNRKLSLDNKNLKKRNKRLIERCKKLKKALISLKKKINGEMILKANAADLSETTQAPEILDETQT